MFRVSKKMEISAMHQLSLNYDSPCQNPHGHNWIITVLVEGFKLDGNGMLVDFTALKKLIHDKLDHKNLNTIFDFNPTAENMAKWIADRVNDYLRASAVPCYCKQVKVEETQGNYAEWEAEIK